MMVAHHHHHHHAKASVSNETTVIQARKRAQLLMVRNLQIEAFEEEFDSLEKKKGLSKTSPLLKLNAIIDSDGHNHSTWKTVDCLMVMPKTVECLWHNHSTWIVTYT
jgi:hypothetical protein